MTEWLSRKGSLTGATRYRAGWFGHLVLQVQETFVSYYEVKLQPNVERTPVFDAKWRDAVIADLTMLEYIGRKELAKANGEPPPPPPDRYATLIGGYQGPIGANAPANPPHGGSSAGHINEGRVRKGGRNTESKITKRPDPPASMTTAR